MRLFLATNSGLHIADNEGGDWQVIGEGLIDHHVTTVIAREGVILAGTKDGIFRSADGGQTWTETAGGLVVRHVRWLAFHPQISDFELAGTESAALFISRDGGESWQERTEVAALRDMYGWWLPYSPEAGCVRGFACHGQRLYAAVEVGGLLRSLDGGQTWALAPGSDGQPQFGQPAPGRIHPDVHSVEVHPSTADRVFAPTAGGLYASTDGGASWQALHRGGYVRAVWIDPSDPDRIVLGPSDGPSGVNGRIEVSGDGGASWQKTAAHWPRNMVERFKPLADSLLAVMANGQVLQTPLPVNGADLTGLTWTQILPDVRDINDVTAML